MTSRRAVVGGLASLGLLLQLRRTDAAQPAVPSERVLVVGATGRLGGCVVRELRGAGYRVRALVRPGRDTHTELLTGVEAIVGDLRDPASVVHAMDGVDRVVFTASASAGGDGTNNPEAVDYGGVVNVVAAASASTRQILLMSSASVTQRLHPHNMWKDILLWKFRGEERLRASGIPYTVLRPTGMRDYPGGEEGIGFAQGDPFAFGYVICRDDVAAVCAAALSAPRALGTTFEAYNESALAIGPLKDKFLSLEPDKPS